MKESVTSQISIFFFLILILPGCQGGTGPGSSSGETCKSSINVFSENHKVHISDLRVPSFHPGNPAFLNPLKNLKAGVFREKGSSITAVYDNRCRAHAGPSVVSELVHLEQDMGLEDLELEAQADPCLIGLSDARTLHRLVSGLDDPKISSQRHLKSLGLTESYDDYFNIVTGVTRDVIVAVVDDGVDLTHEDLEENLWLNAGEVAGNGKDDDGNGFIDDVNGYNFPSRKGDPNPEGSGEMYDHGTHVSGLAAARAENGKGGSGVMGRRVKIMSLNVFGKQTGAATPDIDNAIRYAADNGADVINLSLGGYGRTSSTEAALKYAVGKGSIIFAASGNDGLELTDDVFSTPISYGAEINGMFGIGSVDSSSDKLSSFSNYSDVYVELVAPGSEDSKSHVGVLSSIRGDDYSRHEGTSMASPVAAGAGALVLGLVRSRGKQLTPAGFEKFLLGATPSNSLLDGKVKGSKSVDLKATIAEVNRVYPYDGPIPEPSPDSGGDPSKPTGCP